MRSNIGDSNGALKKSEKPMGKIAVRSLNPVNDGTSYPERANEPDCAYYMRTGSCAYGSNCRFNHPPNVKQTVSSKGELPERVGQPDCQFYLKTGTCKFGASCKYHHPRYRNGSEGQMQINYLGLPLRQGEKECAYYMRTGSCKYGISCKFHHPEPTTAGGVPASNYGVAGSPATPVSSYPPGVMSWPLTRSPYVPSPRIQGSPGYFSVYFPPQGMMPMSTWHSLQGSASPFLSPARYQQSFGARPAYNFAQMNDSSSSAMKGIDTSALTSHMASMKLVAESQTSDEQKEAFPERQGQPECQYYMKTGDCKFGSSCKYHHPKERVPHTSTFMLSPIGLPLRPDQPPCTFYSRFGVCKFGPTCKFDHPMEGLSYNSSVSSFPRQQTSQYVDNSSTTTPAHSSSSGNSQANPLDKKLHNAEVSADGSHQTNSDTVSSKELDSQKPGGTASESE